MKKVAIISTGHPPFDERIFNKIGLSLIKFGYKVNIIVTTQNINIEKNGIKIIGNDLYKTRWDFFSKFNFINKYLSIFNPDLIICCEPLPVIIAFIFTLFQKRKSPSKIIYDITEWYPENIYLKRKGIKKILLYLLGHLINFFSTNFADYLFVGEETKLPRYRKYSPKKKYSIISYYPILEYYNASTQKFLDNNIIFGYAGVISISRGLEIYYQIIKTLKKMTNLRIGFNLIGRFEFQSETIYLDKFKVLGIEFNYHDWTDYSEFSKFLEPVHICFDIRPPNGIYERSLPIKIFDYMAMGKCVIASNYEPIKNIIKIANCGILVDPNNLENILENILKLMQNPDLIHQYGINGRTAAEKFFNWGICEAELRNVLSSI